MAGVSNSARSSTAPLVFLDTNILLQIGRPRLKSAELESLVETADKVGSTVYLPQIVYDEFLQHRLDDLEKERCKASGAADVFGHYSHQWVQTSFPNITEMMKIIVDYTNQWLSDAGLKIAPRPELDIEDIISRAVRKERPFRDANKGFKDELIVHSMLATAQREGYEAVLLVTNDNVFYDDMIQKRFKVSSLSLFVDFSLSKGAERLESWMDEEVRASINKLKCDLLELARSNWADVEKAAKAMVGIEGVPRYDYKYPWDDDLGGGRVDRILEVTPKAVDKVIIGTPEQGSDRYPVTLPVQCSLKLGVEFYGTGNPWATHIYPQGEKAPPAERRWETRDIRRTVFIGAEAERKDDKWVNLKLMPAPNKGLEWFFSQE